MSRFILTCFIFNISILIYAQQENEILRKAVQSYNKELPKLENQAFRILRKLDKSSQKVNKSEFRKYQFLIIPMFKLKDSFVQYDINDTNTFTNYMDFSKIHYDFDVLVYKDSIYKGFLHFSNYNKFYFSVNDTNKYNKPAFIGTFYFGKQILKIKPDLILYPESRMFICFIKEGKFYIGKWTNKLIDYDNFLTVEEYIKKNNSFITELQIDQKLLKANHSYIELK